MTDRNDTPGWTEVRVLVPRGWGELVADALQAGSGSSVAVAPGEGSAAESEWVHAALARSEDTDEVREQIRGALAALGSSTGLAELEGLEPEFHEIPDEDWAGAWRKTWKPFRVGKLCVVTPEWEGRPREGEKRLDLIPGGTFGTGRHTTTRMCIRFIQETMKPGERLLDAGTGTGILAVTAALFGAARTVGFDVDPASRPAALELARTNGVPELCDFRHGGFEVLTAEDVEFDGLLANLYSDLIQEHAPALAARVRPGGWFAVSGCPVRHMKPTRAAVESAGFSVHEVRTSGAWCTIVGVR